MRRSQLLLDAENVAVSYDLFQDFYRCFRKAAQLTSAGRTVVEKCMQRWADAGYDVPKIVYWNLAGYAGQPATAQSGNTGLVSGFSPSILKAILTGEDFSPVAIMRRALEKYQVAVP